MTFLTEIFPLIPYLIFNPRSRTKLCRLDLWQWVMRRAHFWWFRDSKHLLLWPNSKDSGTIPIICRKPLLLFTRFVDRFLGSWKSNKWKDAQFRVNSIYTDVLFRTFQEERDCPQFGTCDGEFKNIHHTIRAGIVLNLWYLDIVYFKFSAYTNS